MEFQYIEAIEGKTKEGKQYVRIMAYCPTYQFLTRIFCSLEQFAKLKKHIEETHDYNITKFVNVYYDSKSENFRFSIN